mmetsp:Transcript_115807/g.180999  ORF Transcript_115807/g.180999 Transcript_115807/m.180999 type:complete len:113 (-) Transcript_115807:74-412(-)
MEQLFQGVAWQMVCFRTGFQGDSQHCCHFGCKDGLQGCFHGDLRHWFQTRMIDWKGMQLHVAADSRNALYLLACQLLTKAPILLQMFDLSAGTQVVRDVSQTEMCPEVVRPP